jgi:glucose-1-phosphate cytidylyltransferase
MEPFYRLIAERKLMAFEYDGFWGCIDTFKDKQVFDELYDQGNAPWEVWKNTRQAGAAQCKA